jgi:hypothetical protein
MRSGRRVRRGDGEEIGRRMGMKVGRDTEDMGSGDTGGIRRVQRTKVGRRLGRW